MAGRPSLRRRGGRFAAALAVTLLMFAGRTQAQYSSAPAPTPATNWADMVGDDTPMDVMPASMTAPAPVYYPGYGTAAPRVITGPIDTITESIFGKPDPNTWRPLPLSTFFTEGWNEAWVPSPNGSGGAPRQGWINAADSNLYRLMFFTFAQAFNSGPKGNAYLGAYTIFTPLSRRLDLITNVPFAVRNSAASGLPIIHPTLQQSTFTSQSTFGDISFTPRFLLHETKDFSLTTELSVLVPTGNQPIAGKTALTPAGGFWYNFADRWVIRGGIGDLIPLKGGGPDTLISQLALGKTFTDHDVALFGDFTLYVSAVVNTPLREGQHTSATLTPGLRTHLGRDYYFLAGLPTPVTNARIGDLGMIFWFMKKW